jgi:hypothetical protein
MGVEILTEEDHREDEEVLDGMMVRVEGLERIFLKVDRVGRLVMEVMLVMGRVTKAMSSGMVSSVLVRGGRIMAPIGAISKGTTITMMAAAGMLIMGTMVLVVLLQIIMSTLGISAAGMPLQFLGFRRRSRNWCRRRQKLLQGSLLAGQRYRAWIVLWVPRMLLSSRLSQLFDSRVLRGHHLFRPK